jgi:hypothetical protein
MSHRSAQEEGKEYSRTFACNRALISIKWRQGRRWSLAFDRRRQNGAAFKKDNGSQQRKTFSLHAF